NKIGSPNSLFCYSPVIFLVRLFVFHPKLDVLHSFLQINNNNILPIPKRLEVAGRRQVSDKFVGNKFAQPKASLW
ncbi:hypothetical protein JVW08_14525, partial [Vibrio cholerae O1]|uniref:hypothetical protein n=1 Tax=Vibrio cholerae TaxID=666 RepID=UPI001C11C326